MRRVRLTIIIVSLYTGVAILFGEVGPNIAYELEDECPYGVVQGFNNPGSDFIFPGFMCIQPESPVGAILQHPSYLITSTLSSFLNTMETFVFEYLNRPGEIVASVYPITPTEEKYLFWNPLSYWTIVGIPSLLIYVIISLIINELWRYLRYRKMT